jgi:NADPH-dependent glutamate synthase beta subunit-like oxidoreductase
MESKCPVCQAGTLEDWNRKVRQCDSCDFKCDTDDLPRIAAAMEFAMKVHLYHNKDGYLDEINDAEKRVVEVFGGE